MKRYRALHPSSGFMGRTYWEPGTVSAPTDLDPPVSRFLGPLFEELTEEANQKVEETLAETGGMEKETLYSLTGKMTQKSKVGMNHKPKEE